MAQKHQILVFSTSYLPLAGGAELALQNLTDRLPEISFDLVTGYYDSKLFPRERIGNVNVFRVGGRLSFIDFILPKLIFPISAFLKGRELLRKRQYDLVYVVQASQAAGAVWLLKKFGYITVPVVINIQEGKNLNSQSLLTKFSRDIIIRSADYFVVISNYLREFLISRGVSKDKISHIPNGVDVDIFKRQSGDPLKQELQLGSDKIVMTVSRLVDKNGIRDLIAAFSIVHRSIPNTRLVVIGSGVLEGSLKQYSREMGLEGSILFLGHIPYKRLPEYLSVADVFVRPSLSEGLGTAFLEAMACGVPVIGTPIGGIPDFLTDGQTGLFCKVGDPSNIANAIIRVLSDQDLNNKLIKTGRDLIGKRYTWDGVANQFRQVLSAL